MAEEKLLAESLIPGENERVAVLAYGIKHYMYFVIKICDAANKNVHNNFTYIERTDQLRAAHNRYSKIVALVGWRIRKQGSYLDEVDDILNYFTGEPYNIPFVEVNDREI